MGRLTNDLRFNTAANDADTAQVMCNFDGVILSRFSICRASPIRPRTFIFKMFYDIH